MRFSKLQNQKGIWKFIGSAISFTLLFSSFACRNKVSENSSAPSKACYAYNQNDSEVLLALSSDSNEITGTLIYAFKEKDKNTGTISGIMRGDTLFATYAFTSEGIQGERDVVFLRSGDSLVEGMGEINAQTGEPDFSDRSKIRFQNGLVLEKTECAF